MPRSPPAGLHVGGYGRYHPSGDARKTKGVTLMHLIARRYDTGEVAAIHLADGEIQRVEPVVAGPLPPDVPWVAPGFVDLQVNGYGGRDFTSPALTVAEVAQIGTVLARQGVTRYCPTVTTQSFEVLAHALRTIARACETDPTVAAQVAGIHLEGPYISPDDGPRGAHPRPHVRPPDGDEFQRLQAAAEGRIRLLTLSPEYPAAPAFIAQARATGTVVAIGHTSADSEQIRAAVDAGATISTHLGNGSHGQLRRHPNYIWDQLAEDRLTASLIVDGHHLPPAVVKTFLRAKTPARCVLVSDMVSLAGLPPGRYEPTGLAPVEILDDGRLVVAGQRQLLAGAALPITVGIANLLRFTDVSFRTAVDLASVQPAAAVDLPAGGLVAGARADLVLFQLPGADGRGPVGTLQVLATILAGRLLYADPAFTGLGT